MDSTAHRHINTSSDSELLLNIFADQLQKTGKTRIDEEDIFTAIGNLMGQVKGAYACVAMLAGFGIIAWRDPHGIRPLGFGTRKDGKGEGKDRMFASESVVADAAGFLDWEDVKAGEFLHLLLLLVIGLIFNCPLGEAVIVTRNSISRRHVAPEQAKFAPDVYEYIYFARPDSILDGISVYRCRMAMGDMLADQVKKVLEEQKISVDVVIPVCENPTQSSLSPFL